MVLLSTVLGDVPRSRGHQGCQYSPPFHSTWPAKRLKVFVAPSGTLDQNHSHELGPRRGDAVC